MIYGKVEQVRHRRGVHRGVESQALSKVGVIVKRAEYAAKVGIKTALHFRSQVVTLLAPVCEDGLTHHSPAALQKRQEEEVTTPRVKLKTNLIFNKEIF